MLVEGHRDDAELLGELAHAESLDTLRVGQGDGGVQHPLLAQGHAVPVELARASGALGPLAIVLNGRAMFDAWCGDLEAAAAAVAEEESVKEATGQELYP